MNSIFITGGLGFLGQRILESVQRTYPAAQLRVLRRTHRPLQVQLDHQRVVYAQGDLSDPASYTPALQGAQAVIHNAAVVSFKPQDRPVLLRANIDGTRQLVQAAAQAGVQTFVFISSISAVGRNAGGLSTENDYPDLAEKARSDPYGYSKLLGEQAVNKYAGQMRVVSLNPSVIIGPGSERIQAVRRAARFVPILPMIETMNSFVDVRDAADAAVLALSHGLTGERYIVTAWNVPMAEFARLALRAAGSRAPVVPISQGGIWLIDGLLAVLNMLRLNPGVRNIAEINVDKAFDSTKIQQGMGWQPHISLEQSLADTLNSP